MTNTKASSPTPPRAAVRKLSLAATVLFALAVPVLLITANVLSAFNSKALYTGGLEKYGIVDVLQMPMQELERVAADLRAYWNDSRDEISTQYAGKPFFTQREVAHLRDVKALVRGVGAMRWVTLGLAAGALGLIVFALRGAAWRQALRACAWAGGVTLALVAFSGLVFLFAFDWAFLLFHRLSFANNFWQLRCPGDNLVCMFPQGFWYDATMTIVLSTVVQAVVLLAVGLAAPWLVRRFARAPSGSRDSLA